MTLASYASIAAGAAGVAFGLAAMRLGRRSAKLGDLITAVQHWWTAAILSGLAALFALFTSPPWAAVFYAISAALDLVNLRITKRSRDRRAAEEWTS